jgi:hypothetical protein
MQLITGGNLMKTVMEKDEAHKLIDQLPQGATWDDLMHLIYVRETIEHGLKDSEAGRVKEGKEIHSHKTASFRI